MITINELVMVNLILTIVLLPFTIYVMVELSAFKKSTHSVQYIDPKDDFSVPDFPESTPSSNISSSLAKKFNDDDEFLE